MASKKPLALYNGIIQELKTTDIIDNVDIAAVKSSVDTINATNQTQPLTLKHGYNAIMTDRDTFINNLILYGRTLVNLVGRDGNCEDISKWFPWQCTLSLDTSVYATGYSSIKATSSVVGGFNMTTINKVTIDNTKHHLVIGKVKTGTVGGEMVVYLATPVGGAIKYATIPANTSLTTAYVKVTPTEIGSNTSVEPLIQGVATAIGQYFNVDAFSVYQIDQATYNLIDIDPEYTGDKLAEKYPFGEGYQVVQDPMVTVAGKNLLPPFYSEYEQAALSPASSIVTILSPYSLQMVVTDATAETAKPINVDCLPNTQYTITNPSSNGYIRCRQFYSYVMGVVPATPDVTIVVAPGQSYTFTTSSNAHIIRINFTNYSGLVIETGTFTFTNPMLNLGSTALPFEVADPSYKYFPCKLGDGETLQEIDGASVLTRKIKDVVLDGSLAWVFHTVFGGTMHSISYPIVSMLPTTNNVAIKFDGKILKSGTVGTVDIIDTTSTTGTLYVEIEDTDSGWGQTLTPSVAEMQAMMYGWKMNNGTFGTPYDGIGTKTWTAWSATSNTGSVPVCPTTPSIDITNKVYDYYQLHCTLATPTTEIVVPEGSLGLHEGANQVGLSEGVIVRESVVPSWYSPSSQWLINNKVTGTTGNLLKNRVSKIIAVYKNDVLDLTWTVRSGDGLANGIIDAYNTTANYDPTASYSVTYEVLDKYLYTTNALTATGTYDTNDHTVLGHTVEKVTDVETRVSVVERNFSRKQQGQWITPTLLNGWTGIIKYVKDDFGWVSIQTGSLASGVTTVGTIMFSLPVGFRPAFNLAPIVYGYLGSGTVGVNTDGTITVGVNISNVWLFLNIRFRAEQ